MRPRATEIVNLFLIIANDTESHPSNLNERARQLARTLSNLTPRYDRDGNFEKRACAYVVITAAASAYERASFLFKHQREVETYNALEWARASISGLDGICYRAQRELEEAWDALFEPYEPKTIKPAQPETITLVRSKADYCAECDTIHPDADRCPLTGDEYGTPA